MKLLVICQSESLLPHVVNEAIQRGYEITGVSILDRNNPVVEREVHSTFDAALLIYNIEGMHWETIIRSIYETVPHVIRCTYPSQWSLTGTKGRFSKGIILGPGFVNSGLEYWYGRLAIGGEVLAPGEASRKLRVIDIRDLAKFYVDCLEVQGENKLFQPEPGVLTTMYDFLSQARTISGGDATFTWLSDDFLTKQGMTPATDWQPHKDTDIPLWIRQDESAHMAEAFTEAKENAPKMQIRPVASTLQDAYDWYIALPKRDGEKSILVEREREILSSWHKLSVPYRSEAMEMD